MDPILTAVVDPLSTVIRYECRRCGSDITRSAYRMTCPDCGGLLRRARRGEPVR